MSSTITASNSQQTPTSESTTGFYATSDITTDDSTSVYNTTTQNVLSSSTKPTTVYTSTSNAATAQTIVSNSSETAMSLSSGTSQGSFPAGGNVNVTATMVPIQVVAKNHSRTTSSSRLVSSTTRTNGKHPQSVRASTSPLNHAKVHTGVSQTPVVVPASLSTIGNTAQIGCGAPPSIDGAKMISK